MKVVWVIRGESRSVARPPRSWWQRPGVRGRDSTRRYLTQRPVDAEVYNTQAKAEAAAERIAAEWARLGSAVITQVRARRVL